MIPNIVCRDIVCKAGWLSAVLAVGLTSCGSTPAAEGAEVSVVASFYPLFEAAQRVGGGRVDVTNLTPAGSEPHDLEVTAGDLVAVQEADLVLYLGDGFQPALERAVRDRTGPSIDVLDGLVLLEGAPDEHAGEEGEHATDPHVWLDPVRYAQIVQRIREELIEVDPDGADAYEEAASTYQAEIDALDEEFTTGLQGCDRNELVVSHAAFGYLASRYDLHQEALAGISPESEPTPARLAELRDLVRREGVTVVFSEQLASPRVAQALAREAGVRSDVLDPLEGLTEDQQRAGETYASVMRENLAKLVEALGCKG
jgi:zinc transport system substrate-binding protein